MTKERGRKQKPWWKRIRKPIPPPGKAQGTKKGDKGYKRKKRGWEEEESNEEVSDKKLTGKHKAER